MNRSTVLIVGAGPAGLALAACLKRAGIACLVLEKESAAGASWRRHYDRLHLHTPRAISGLPYFSYRPGTPRYPSRDQFITYLEDYARHFGIEPVCNTNVLALRKEEAGWVGETAAGSFASRFLVMATGQSQMPQIYTRPGTGTFNGPLLHSMQYRSGRDFKGMKVMVAGFGNSACEIAMDLYEQGAMPVMSVRSPVNLVPRELFGIPVLYWAIALSALPAGIADRISAPLLRSALGDITDTGLQKAAYGPFGEVKHRQKIPAIDTGALRYIREKKIRVTGDLLSVSGNMLTFSDGSSGPFDAIIAATGYEISWPAFHGLSGNRIADLKKLSSVQSFFSRDAVYSCGFSISGTGMIRAIGLEAKRITADIAHRVKTLKTV